ncbi:OLC1v1037764C1 [Oldenlandia corymbosa var. corymbosa]|uniref:OLC1v1037764C1 n=1 Tax=Oldenlandia corymbosa var. corymbosa TaxID=529605 RepID=A0AAV1CY59_OLDCO|nr:OLC1v1037764C1 [Oldenlandia corymbosa var. corymbosa]
MVSKSFAPYMSWLDGVVDDEANYMKYITWSAWSIHEAEKMALKAMCWVAANDMTGEEYCGDLISLFRVGRDGLLQSHCAMTVQSPRGEEISVEEALELMIQTLSSRLEVGLIAGWDDKTECPVSYRVDGMGGLITGKILATGSRFRGLHDFLDLNCLIDSKRSGPPGSWLDGVLDDESQIEKYNTWLNWSVHEAEKMALKAICYIAGNDTIPEDYGGDLASVFYVGRHGLVHSQCDLQVEDVLRKFGTPPPMKWEVIDFYELRRRCNRSDN